MSDAIIKIYASQDWVENAIANIPEVDMSEYATETYVDDAISELSSQNLALTADQISALDGMFKVCAFIKEDVSAEYNAFKTAFGISDSGGEEEPDEPVTPEKTLTGISATYSGGDVAVGTAVSALTGIVVTAHYSDGTSATVTGYTLSGEIAEGSNTVTVTYQGKTASFDVTGVAESGGEESPEAPKTWTDLIADVEFKVVTSEEYNLGIGYGMMSTEKVTIPAGTYYLYDIHKAASGASPKLYTETDGGALTAITALTVTDNNGLFQNGNHDAYGNEKSSTYQPNDGGYMVEYIMVLTEDFYGYLHLNSNSYVLKEPGYTWLFTKKYNPHKDTLVLA